LQRLGELPRAFSELARAGPLRLEQSRVLHGDHRLVGEGLEQLDLSVREWSHLGASDRDRTDCFARAHERDRNYGAVAESPGKITALRVLIRFGLQISDLDRFSV